MKLNPKYYELFKELQSNTSNTSNTSTLNKNSNVLIVDGMNTFIRCWSVVPNLNDNGEHIGGVIGFLKSIGYAIRELNPTRVVIVFDGKHSSRSRKKVYSEYKSNRGKNKLRVNRGIYEQLNDEDEQESKRRQIILLAEMLLSLPVTVMLYDAVEADDVMAYVSNRMCDEKSIIMSSDNDFLQLVGDDCMVWSPTKSKLYTKELVFSEYGIPTHNFLTYRILDGDKSDNIAGIQGAGLKSIIKRFPAIISDDTITVDEIVSHAENKKGKIKLYDTVLDNVDILERNYKLMQLSDVDVNGQLKLQIQSRFREDITELNKSEFIGFLNREKISNGFADPIGWLNSTFGTLDYYRK